MSAVGISRKKNIPFGDPNLSLRRGQMKHTGDKRVENTRKP